MGCKTPHNNPAKQGWVGGVDTPLTRPTTASKYELKRKGYGVQLVIICMINLIAVIQLISQLKGYFYINPLLAISLAITIFSFTGIPPLAGFFGKQMVLSAALDKGLIFLSIIAILTSVIGGIYYLTIIKEMFLILPEYKVNTLLENLTMKGTIVNKNKKVMADLSFNYNNIVISSPISFVISIITLVILLFLFMNRE